MSPLASSGSTKRMREAFLGEGFCAAVLADLY